MLRLWLTFPFFFVLAQKKSIPLDNRIPYAVVDTQKGRIVGGKMTSIEDYPYQISLQYNNQHACGGAIISQDWVITAAHCVVGGFSHLFTIKAGKTDISQKSPIKSVKNIFYHSDYNPQNFDCDIAVMQMREPFVYSHQIRPIMLPSRTDYYYKLDSIAVVTGWGRLSKNGTMISRLQEVQVPLVSNAQCWYSYPGRITSKMLCAGSDVGGKDSCKGDSGSPMVQNDRLIGIVSWGYSCAEPNYPGIYTAVAPFRYWIKETTGV